MGAATKINAALTNNSLSSGLVGYWSFDGKDMAGTTAYDRSGQGNNGTLINGPTRTIGKIGQGLSFDGSDDFVDISSTFTSTSNFSASVWVNQITATSNGSFEAVISTNPYGAGDNFGIWAQGNTGTGVWYFQVVGDGIDVLFVKDPILQTLTLDDLFGDFQFFSKYLWRHFKR